MSGHSKWAQIKRQKGAADIKRGQLFTKLANAITIAVKQGGGTTDPESNFKLRLAIDRARSYNMPKENIERSLRRAAGKQDGGVEEVVYEGFGPGGIAVIVEAVTDNRQRTTSEVKNSFENNGGSLAKTGAVSYQFEQKGLITVHKNGKSFDKIFMIAAESGAEDVEEVENSALIYTKPEELKKIKDELVKNGLNIVEAELTRKPLNTIAIRSKDSAQKILAFIEKIEELDDVQKVYANFDIPDNILEEIKAP